MQKLSLNPEEHLKIKEIAKLELYISVEHSSEQTLFVFGIVKS